MKPMGPIPSGFVADEKGRLLIGGLPVEDLVAGAGGTPLFVYDRRIVSDRVARFREAMPAQVALHYAVKANPYRPLLTHLASLVGGFDVASGGELAAVDAMATGLPISFAGPGKTDLELDDAIALGATINLESEGEAERALDLAERSGTRPKLAVRVNPPFQLKGAGMKMGGLASPFGVDHDRAADLVRHLLKAGADWRGLHIFTGSQSLSADALIEAQRASMALAAEIATEVGYPPPEVNLGGGFGIPYFYGEQELDIGKIGEALWQLLDEPPDALSGTRYALELGRWLVGTAGVYLTRILDRKESGGRTFLVTDGGLHHMLAASGNFGQLLRRNYPVAIASRFGEEPNDEVTVTGCLCTPLDVLADDVELPFARRGELVAVFCAGAYGLTASPQAFLGQSQAREMLV